MGNNEELCRTCRSLVMDEFVFFVQTDGNFSLISKTWETAQNSPLGLGFLRMLLYKFERQFDLKVINWEVQEHLSLKLVEILVNHEPKEKAEVASAGQEKNPKSPFCPGSDFGPDH